MRRAFLSAIGLTLVSCGAAPSSSKPASAGVAAYLSALERDDPSAAYSLLSEGTRDRVGYRDFEARWRGAATERKLQAAALKEGLKSGQGLRERALVGYRDGKRIGMRREGTSWQLTTPLSSTNHAARPEDAVRMFAEALTARDYERLLGVLSSRRREGIAKHVTGFMKSLGAGGGSIPAAAGNRAELMWEADGSRYKIVLIREQDDWRIDDLHVEELGREK